MNWQLKNNSTVKCLFGLAHHVPDSKMEKAVIKNYLKGSHMYFLAFEKCTCCHECVVYHPGSADFSLLQKQSTRRLFIKYVFRKTPRKTLVLDSLFSANFAKCLKASFLWNISGRQLLSVRYWYLPKLLY